MADEGYHLRFKLDLERASDGWTQERTPEKRTKKID